MIYQEGGYDFFILGRADVKISKNINKGNFIENLQTVLEGIL